MKKNNYGQLSGNNFCNSTIHFSQYRLLCHPLTRKSSAIKTFIVAGILLISINHVLAQKQHPYLFYTPQRVNLLNTRAAFRVGNAQWAQGTRVTSLAGEGGLALPLSP